MDLALPDASAGLLAAFAAAAALVVLGEARLDASPARRRARAAVRATLLATVALAAARPVVREAAEAPRALVLAVDGSALSATPGEAVAARLGRDAAAAAATGGFRLAVLSGSEPVDPSRSG